MPQHQLATLNESASLCLKQTALTPHPHSNQTHEKPDSTSETHELDKHCRLRDHARRISATLRCGGGTNGTGRDACGSGESLTYTDTVKKLPPNDSALQLMSQPITAGYTDSIASEQYERQESVLGKIDGDDTGRSDKRKSWSEGEDGSLGGQNR